MFRLSAIAFLIAAGAAPAFATDLRTTHEVLPVPPGKIHSMAFRPLKTAACPSEVINPAGSRIQAAPAGAGACAVRTAPQLAERK